VTAWRYALPAVLAAGCGGASGTISVEIITAPGSTVMDDVTRARLVLTLPFTVVEADRDASGHFDLTLDVIAEGPSGDVLFEGLDADGNVIAYGRTPSLPIAAIDAAVKIYVAAPRSLAEAPVSLGVARSEIGTGLLDYGVLLAGGRDADGEPTRDLQIYNAYDHSLQTGADLPEARASVTVGTGIIGYAYLFGGEDADGDPRGTVWTFDTTVAPDGRWTEGNEVSSLARAGAAIAPLGSETFVVTGTPPVLLEGLFGRATGFDEPDALAGGAASVQAQSGEIFTLFIGEGAGATGIVRLFGSDFAEEPDAPAGAIRHGHAVVATAQGDILAIGGADASGVLSSVIKADPLTRSYPDLPDVLATGRTDAAAAATSAFLVVAGGRDAAGDIVPDAEIFDADTLDWVATIPMVVPRTGATARALPNHQVLIVGGVDASGAPVDTIELYTPDPPDLTQ
jgi:hypothetical protein